MQKRLSFKEALARRDEIPAERPLPSGTPVALVLSAGEMRDPVSVARLIRSLGHSLRKAHESLDRLAEGRQVPIELIVPKDRDVVAELAGLGVTARPVAAPAVDVRAIRDELDLTQQEFAIRFGLQLDTVQNWEQGRTRPDPAAAVLLRVIATNPAAVDAALAPS